MARAPHRLDRLVAVCLPAFLAALVVACATTPQPREVSNVCAIFDQHPEWYDAAKAAEARWGTPAHILMAFIHQESAFRQKARPPRPWLLGIVPLPRRSSAYGYGQIQDAAWHDYRQVNGGFLKSRTDMKDVLDFIGWYNDVSARRLGLSKWDPKHLYLAYHEGHAGYRSGRWRGKPALVRIAERVDWRAREYGAQLARCEPRLECRHFWQVGPLCQS